MTQKPPDLNGLIHDVNSKCSSLKSAAGLLRTSPPEELRELVGLMAKQARSLAESIERCEAALGSQ